MATSLFTGTKHAQLYSKFRPSSPQYIIDYIITFLNRKVERPFENAIDIGCGSGQSTKILSPYFKNILGLDVSEAQIENAKKLNSSSNVEYKVSRGETLPILTTSVQLVTLSQSIHWFNTDELFTEVRRVLVPNGVIAAYGYWIPLPKLDGDKYSKIHELITEYLYEDQLGKYWNKERYIVQDHYRGISFPFKDSQRVNYVKKGESSLKDYMGYLSTWSSYQKLLKEDQENARALLQKVENMIIEILGVKKPPEEIVLPLYTDYFMIIGSK